MSLFEQRRDKLRRELRRRGVENLLVTNFTNVTYLTGFTGDDSYLLVTPRDAIMFSDARYDLQLQEECPDIPLEIRPAGTQLLPFVAGGIASLNLPRLGIEGDSLTVSGRDELSRLLPHVDLLTTARLVEELRVIKDHSEVELIRRAASIAGRAFSAIRAVLSEGITERQIAHELEHIQRRLGAQGCSFPPIVAVGDRSALPHYRPGNQSVGKDGLILIDWGADVSHYKSDLTRVLRAGRIPPKLKRIHDVVSAAQAVAISAVRHGAECRAVDAAARDVIARAGWGKYFTHGLGHGIGLEIHEAPRLGPNATGTLKSGMVVTIEPGIYLPGVGGVRIEDDVLVTRDGCQVLTDVPKAWAEIEVEWS